MVARGESLHVSNLGFLSKPKAAVYVRNSWVDERYVSHSVCRGPPDKCKENVRSFVSYGYVCSEEAITYALDEWHECALKGGWDREPATFEEILSAKNMHSRPGEPFDLEFTTFGDMLEEYSPVVMKAMLEEYEAELEAGRCPLALFRTHLKEDRMSEKKQRSDLWRDVQGVDAMTLMVCMKYMLKYCNAAELVHPRIMLYRNWARWNEMLVDGVGSRPTAGLDYSRYDQSESGMLIERLIRSLLLRAGAPLGVACSLAKMTAYGWTVTSDGEVFERAGGNPSGNLLTGVLNSLVNDIMHLFSWSTVLSVPVSEVLEHVDWVVCGDDTVESPTSLGDLQEVMSEMVRCFGIVPKVDLCDGQLYPIGCHAPFCSRVTLQVDGVRVVLPSEPCRTLSSWQVPGEETDTDGVYTGIMQEMVGYRFLWESNSGLPVPSPVVAFFSDYATRLGERTMASHKTLLESLAIMRGDEAQ